MRGPSIGRANKQSTERVTIILSAKHHRQLRWIAARENSKLGPMARTILIRELERLYPQSDVDGDET